MISERYIGGGNEVAQGRWSMMVEKKKGSLGITRAKSEIVKWIL